MPAPAKILRSVGQQYFDRFHQPVPANLVRTVPMAQLIELVGEAIRRGVPLVSGNKPSKGTAGSGAGGK